MKTIHHMLLLFSIIIIEGYVVLSTELLAIRQTIPYVGSGADTISIIIAAVLMPLAFGYQYGGKFRPGKIWKWHITVRKKLIINILVAATILVIGLSHNFIRSFFILMPKLGIDNILLQTTLYSSLFLVIPVYLLGQTVPLISNFFSKEKLSQITGKILFFSTLGSFIGATFSTIFLMSTIGVHHTVSLNFVLLAILVVMLSKNKMSKPVIYMFAIALLAMFLNSDKVMKDFRIKKNNQYNMIVAGTLKNGNRVMLINNNYSSRYNDKGEKYNYIEFAEKLAITPIMHAIPARDILVIGAGGFTFGHNDKTNNYTYIDIDEDMQEVAEKYVLKEPIGENKIFIPKPARGFLNSTDKKYDVIYLDAFQSNANIPEHLVTQEFFEQIKKHLKNNGILITNFTLSPHFNNAFARNIDNTFRSVFPHFSRHVINNEYNLWSDSKTLAENVAYIYRHEENYDRGHIYTDNKNTVFYDKPKKVSP